MKFFGTSLLILVAVTLASAQWAKQTVNTTANFRGLSVVNEKIVWASGTGGTVVRTVDGGKNWDVIAVPRAQKLDFRDIEAFDARTAYVLSIGNGESSRIYRTADGGKTWKLQFTNRDEKAFYDAIACWDRNNCIAMSDPVEGHYPLFATSDVGANRTRIVSNQMPAAKDGEAAFAASGTCLIAVGRSTAYLVSGGTDARVFRSDDRARTWAVVAAPLTKAKAAAGIFSIAMRDARNGVIVGGDYEKPELAENNVALTSDGGKTWTLGTGLKGYRSGVAFVEKDTYIAVGTNGVDISSDGGRTWQPMNNENLNAVQSKGRKATWAVGPKGLVTKLFK
jgi:photosystem II stability/assembly factor-like uncharacterized protein